VRGVWPPGLFDTAEQTYGGVDVLVHAAGSLSFLAGPSRWINGQRVRINGGII
jgi:hypothetical protein